MIIAALIGTLSSVFLSEEKTKREYEKEKLEKMKDISTIAKHSPIIC